VGEKIALVLAQPRHNRSIQNVTTATESTMAYTCDLGSGQRLYLDNMGQQTAVTLASGGPGQQQQSGSQFTTGTWTHPPELFRTAQGVVVKLTTAQGPHYLQLQGNQWGSSTSGPNMASAQQMQTSQVAAMPGDSMSGDPMPSMQPMSFDASDAPNPSAPQPAAAPRPSMQPMQPMTPMQPMQPMTLGNMTMNTNPMEMRMGNMAMSMGQPAGKVPETHAPAASAPDSSASGAKGKFCSQCGTPVQPSDRFCANCGHGLGN
jgi:hypothetical protein